MASGYNIWHIDAYSGWQDYDGPADCNYHKDVIMDSSFSKEDVMDMWMSLHRYGVAVIAKCELIKKVEIE